MKDNKIDGKRRSYIAANIGSKFSLKKDFTPMYSRRRWWWNHLSSVCPRMEKFVVSVEIDACFHLQLCEYASKFRRLLPPHQSRGITAKPTLIQNIWICSIWKAHIDPTDLNWSFEDWIYRKVASSQQVYYSVLDPFSQRSQQIGLKFISHS